MRLTSKDQTKQLLYTFKSSLQCQTCKLHMLSRFLFSIKVVFEYTIRLFDALLRICALDVNQTVDASIMNSL